LEEAGLSMDAVTAWTESVEKRTPVRSDARAGEAGAHGADAGGRTLADLKRLADGLMKVLESERTRVAGVLADEVISVITMARYLIEDAAQRSARGEFEETSETLQNASARIRDATQQLVSLCSELRPRVLDDLGLLMALAWYIRDFSRENRAIFVSPRITVTESDVPAELKLTVFRIVQVALSNVARHSKASSARVFLSVYEDELRLVVEDNGVGFDVEHWRNRRHGAGSGCGLGMISRWAEMSGGHCTIESIPRHGARVQVLWRTSPALRAANAAEGSDLLARSARP
jgi:signal transduction histidine kinase